MLQDRSGCCAENRLKGIRAEAGRPGATKMMAGLAKNSSGSSEIRRTLTYLKQGREDLLKLRDLKQVCYHIVSP